MNTRTLQAHPPQPPRSSAGFKGRLPGYNKYYQKEVEYYNRFRRRFRRLTRSEQEKVVKAIKDLGSGVPGLNVRKYFVPLRPPTPPGSWIASADDEIRFTYTSKGDCIMVYDVGHHADLWRSEK